MKLVWDRHLDHFVVIVNGQDVYPDPPLPWVWRYRPSGRYRRRQILIDAWYLSGHRADKRPNFWTLAYLEPEER